MRAEAWRFSFRFAARHNRSAHSHHGTLKVYPVPEDLASKRARWNSRFREIQDHLGSDPPAPEHLYHHSSLSKIQDIVRGGGMWLFDVRTMENDPGDGKRWIEVFRSVLNRKDVPPSLGWNFQPGTPLERGLGSEYYEYVSCFSASSALKDQWDDFGDKGRGCAIELSFRAFIDASNSGHEYGWTPMLYAAEEQRERAEKTVDGAILLRAEGALTPSENVEFWKDAAFWFLVCGTRFKDPKFDPQREWRIFLSRTSEDSERVRYLGSRRYIPWPFPAGVVTGIIKGPNCDCPNEELERLLTAAGYPANVRNAHLESEELVEG